MKIKKNNNWIPILTAVICIIIIGIFYWISTSLDSTLKQKGYKSPENSSPFYKKIYSDRTLEEYLEDVKQEKNSEYEEYNYTKNSSSLIAVKMTYQSGENKSFNISSDLKNGSISFSVEYVHGKERFFLEGNSKDNYNCHIIYQENTTKDKKEQLCREVHNEINIFYNRQNELLESKVIQENIKKSIK